MKIYKLHDLIEFNSIYYLNFIFNFLYLSNFGDSEISSLGTETSLNMRNNPTSQCLDEYTYIYVYSREAVLN